MYITNSPDISLLKVQVIFDLSAAVPVLRFVNQSVGAHLANIDYAFTLYSPNGVPIHVGTTEDPDVSGAWTDHELTEGFSTFGASMEWSGNPYRVGMSIRDSEGTVIVAKERSVMVCMPPGNKNVGSNYGEGMLEVVVDCTGKEALIRDRTPYSFQGQVGAKRDTSSITILQPTDPSGVTPLPQPFIGYSQVAFPLTITGDGYRAVLQATADYNLTPSMGPLESLDIVVRIKYIKTSPFSVNCHYDLCPLLYEFAKMMESADKECDTKMDRKIAKISQLLTQALIVKVQPTCGVSLGKLIDEIKAIGGWNCNCNCSSPVGLNSGSNFSPGDFNITFTTGGDVSAAATVEGSNILLTLRDYSYVFSIANPLSGGRAFEILPVSIAGRVKTFALNVDLQDLAEDLIAKIGGVPALLNSFNALVRGSFNFTVDGKCVISTNQACDYQLQIGGVPLAPLSILFKSITIDGVIYPVGISFNQLAPSLVALKAALDGLGKGSFQVVVAGGYLLLQANANAHAITAAVVYGGAVGVYAPLPAPTDRLMDIAKSNCSGTTVYTPSQIVQAMIDYMCKINATQISLGYDFVFAKMKPDGTLQEVFFKSTDSLKLFIDALNSNAAIAISLGRTTNISFTSIQAIFDNKTNPIKPTDTIFGTRDGVGGQWTQLDIVKSLISVLGKNNDPALLTEWCAVVNKCNGTNVCNPVVFASLAMRVLTKDDFAFVGNELIFVGYYSDITLTTDVNVNYVETNAAGGVGVPHGVGMEEGENIVTSGLAALQAGFTGRRVVSVSGMDAVTQYLALLILNNGAASYKVAIRNADGAETPYTYITVAAQAGLYTRVLYAVEINNYQGSVIAVCGPDNESAAIEVKNPSCPAPLSFNVVRSSGTQFTVSYLFPASVEKYNLYVLYPSGGTINVISDVTTPGVAGSAVVAIPQPYGDYKFKIRAVCNEATNFYGPYSQEILIALSLSDANPSPIGLEISNVTATSATATATAPDPAPGADAITLIYTPTAGGASLTLTHSANNLVWNITGLTPSTQYNVKVRYEYPGGATSPLFDGGNFTTLPAEVVVPINVYYGWTDVAVTAENVDTFVLTHTQTMMQNDVAVAIDFSTAPAYKTFIISELATEPVKIHYTNNLNNEPIPDFTFAEPVIIGLRRYYYTNGAVSFDPSMPVILMTF